MKEYLARAFKTLTVAGKGKVVRLEIGTTEGDIRIFLPGSAIETAIPIFVNAASKIREQLSGKSDVRAVFDVSEVRVALPADRRGIVISLTLPTVPEGEGEMAFRVDTQTAQRLSAALAQIGGPSGEPPKKTH